MITLFDIIKQNKEGSKSSIPVLQSGGLFENFKKGLGLENNNNYRGRNSNSSAVGKYQFLWGEWGDKIKRVTGVKSKDGFENSPKAQEEFFSWYFHNTVKPNVEKIKKDNKLGLRDEEIAALIHFQGEGNAKKIISSGSHSKATSINPSSAEYLKRFNKHLGSQTSSSSEYIAEDSPYSKYDFSNQKLDYSQMNAQMESNQAFQKAMVEAMQSEASSKIALNQAQTLAIEREQAEKLALQEEEKKRVEQEQIQSVLDEKNKQREMLMEVGLQAIPEFIEKDTNVLNQIASSPMNFQFQGGFQQLVQGQEGGKFETINSNVDELEDIELAEVTNLNNKISPFNNIPIYKDVDSFRERNKHLTTNLPVYIDNKLQYEETPMFRENIGDAMFNVADYEIADSEGNLLKLPEQCTARACRVIDSMVGGNSYLEYSDDFKAKIGSTESSKSKPTEEDIAKNPYYYGDENYGSLDAWDIPYMTNKNSPKNVLYDAMRGERVMNQSDVQKNMISYNDLKEKVGEIPVGSFINLGIKNGKNTSEVLGGVHTVRVVGYDKQGEPLVADFDSVKELKKAMYIVGDKDIKSIMSVVSVPGKEKYNYSYFKNLENKSKKDSNENYIKSYSKMPVFNTDTGEIEYEKPSKEFKKYAKTLNKNKNYISALADISDEDYDRYAKIALTLPSVETKYGKDFLYSLGIDGESTGLSQIVQGNVKEKYPKILSKYPEKSVERDALSTVLYLKELDNYKETWFDDAESETERPYFLQNRSNIKDGVRKAQGRDRTGFYKNMLSGYTYNVDGNNLDIDSRNSGESEQDYTDRINSELGDKNLRFELVERGGEDKTPTIYKKTRGNLIKRDLEDSIGYLWQTPNSVRYGDAQGDSKYYKKFKAVYENLFGKKMQKGGKFETINLDEVVVKAETPLTKLGKEFEKNNNYSEFVYGKPQTTFDSYQGRQNKYEKLKNEYIANEISKQYSGKRGRILNSIRDEYGDEMHDFVITNSTNRDVRENVYDNFKSGVLNINGSFNPYRSNREQSKRGNVLLDRLGDIGDISSPLSVPYNVTLGKKVTNSKGETDYTYSDAFSGVVPKEREMTAEIAGDPLNLLGIGIADEALKGFKSIKNILPITAKEQKIFSIDDLVNSNNYYRVIRGEESFNDIANKGIVRSVPPVNTNSIGKINLGGRPTAFPSFSKGKVSKEYAEGDPLNYIIESNSDKIKVSTLGRHGKGTTYFPTDIEGNYINSLDAGEINVYKHLGEGKYEKVMNNIKNKQLFEKGGIFHKMYDNYKKVDINSFKNKFIKSTTHGGFAGKG